MPARPGPQPAPSPSRAKATGPQSLRSSQSPAGHLPWPRAAAAGSSASSCRRENSACLDSPSRTPGPLASPPGGRGPLPCAKREASAALPRCPPLLPGLAWACPKGAGPSLQAVAWRALESRPQQASLPEPPAHGLTVPWSPWHCKHWQSPTAAQPLRTIRASLPERDPDDASLLTGWVTAGMKHATCGASVELLTPAAGETDTEKEWASRATSGGFSVPCRLRPRHREAAEGPS